MKYRFLVVLGLLCFSVGCGKDAVIAPAAGGLTEAELNELPVGVEMIGRPMPAAGDAETAAPAPAPGK